MNAAASYRQFVLLAPHPGWRAATDSLTADENQYFRLDPLAGNPAPVPELAALTEERPIALAARVDGPPYVLCAEDALIRVAPVGCETAPQTLPGVGGKGKDARRFRRLHDIALLDQGAIAVADSGNGAVKVFSAFPHTLLAVWTGLGRPGRLAAGAQGMLWVLDGSGPRVLGVDPDGAVRVTVPGLTAPTALAADPASGRIVILDGTTIRVFDAAGTNPAVAGTVADATAVCFAETGSIYAGTSTGLIHHFASDGAGGWRQAGIGVLGQRATVKRMIWHGGTTLLALVVPEGGPKGAPVASVTRLDTAAARVREGHLTTDELDSGLAHCVWHRIALDADLPDGTSIEVSTEAYDATGGAAPPDLVAAPIVLSGPDRDCLVQGGPGRFLKVRLTLRGDGIATPVLRGIRVWYPRDGWLGHLPAIYQEDPESAAFLSRFLALLQTAFDEFDERIDYIWTLFDARSVPGKWFNWLADWLALPIQPNWTDAQRRAVLRGAYNTYKKRGTLSGLEQLITDYAGVDARLVEHFRLRQLIRLTGDPASAVAAGSGRLWSRDAYRQLQLGVYSTVGMFRLAGAVEPGMEPVAWGANQFSVFFDAAPASVADTQKQVAAVVEREKPAHTQAIYRPVFARMRVGVQATLGVDTRVGTPGEAILCRVSTLGYDAILGGRPLPSGMPTPRAATRPRLGIDTRLS